MTQTLRIQKQARTLLLFLCVNLCVNFATASDKPNILWLSCEDISPHLGCYGDPHAVTPNLDALASRGTRYTHVFTSAGVCAPCRSSIITGMYQNSIGTHHMRCNASLPDSIVPFPMLLRKAGYYCTNNSKTDYQFKKPSPKTIWDESGSKAHWKNRKPNQPFFAVFNFTGCHESGIADESKYRKVTANLTANQRQDPTKLATLPPYYPDTPIVREDWKRNYELITAMDAWAGEHLNALEDAGLSDNTIVIFWSDHGVGLPRAKRWLYDSGTRIPFIVHMPERFRIDNQCQPNSTSAELVSSVDFAPTMLNLAGVQIPEILQGQAFLGDNLAEPRKYVFGARDRMDERYDVIRAVRSKRYRYIRNFEPRKPYYQYMNTPEKGATMKEIRQAELSGTLTRVGKLFSADRKPVEELYDLANDPHEIHNLATNPQQVELLREMRQACLKWQNEIGDLGLVPEAEIEIAEQSAGSRYAILHTADAQQKLATLVEVAAKASEGVSATETLLEALRHRLPAVRYWGATGLGNTGKAVHREAKEPLTRLLDDEYPNVRIAAARGLCLIGELNLGLPVLQAELKSDHQWGRLAAAIALDELDQAAKPALTDLQAALVDQPNKYIVRVANKAVNDLLDSQNVVP